MTQTLAQISPTELAPILTLFAGMLVGFYSITKFLMNQAEKDRQADREERKDLAQAIHKMGGAILESGQIQADATNRGSDEAKERNGHLAELTIENRRAILESIACLKLHQNIAEQVVDEQIIKHETKEV